MLNDATTVPFQPQEPFPGVTLGLLGVTLGGITPSYLALLVVDIVWIAKFLHGLVAIGLIVLVGLHRLDLQNLQNQNLQNLAFVPPDGRVTTLTVYRPDLGARIWGLRTLVSDLTGRRGLGRPIPNIRYRTSLAVEVWTARPPISAP